MRVLGYAGLFIFFAGLGVLAWDIADFIGSNHWSFHSFEKVWRSLSPDSLAGFKQAVGMETYQNHIQGWLSLSIGGNLLLIGLVLMAIGLRPRRNKPRTRHPFLIKPH